MSTWFEIVLTGLLGGFGLYVSWISHKKAKAELFHELFTEFNSRYHELNSHLDKLIEAEKNIDISNEKQVYKLQREYKNIIIDYLNLCAEEFMWKNKKYIDKEVWKSWQEGINWWYYNSAIIRRIWEEEKVNEKSYYMHEGKTFIIHKSTLSM
jgi:hypothetical protein